MRFQGWFGGNEGRGRIDASSYPIVRHGLFYGSYGVVYGWLWAVLFLVWFGLLPTPLCYSDMEYPDGAGRAWVSGSSGAQWGLALQI